MDPRFTNYQKYTEIKNSKLSKKEKKKVLQRYLVGSDRGRMAWTVLIPFFFFIFVCVFICNMMFNAFQKQESSQLILTPSNLDLTGTSIVATMDSFTPYVISTPEPTLTAEPTLTIQPTPTKLIDTYVFQYRETFKLSFYDPEIGDHFPEYALVNCANYDFNIQTCISRILLNHYSFIDYYGYAIACPSWLPDFAMLKTNSDIEFHQLRDREFVCLDRGGAIVDNWIDFLLHYPQDVKDLNTFPFGSLFTADVYFPQ